MQIQRQKEEARAGFVMERHSEPNINRRKKSHNAVCGKGIYHQVSFGGSRTTANFAK